MTYKQAVQEAREIAMQGGRTQVVYSRKLHWYRRKDYGYAYFNVFAVNGDYTGCECVAVIKSDGKLH